jgi:hypothetical protein
MIRTRLLSFVFAPAAAPLAAHAEPNITGMWALDQPAGHVHQDPPKLTAQAAATAAETARITAKAGRTVGEAHTKCWPTGMPGLMQPPFGIEFLQTKGRVTILSEVSNLPRTIYLDEARQPDADSLVPGWNGHSIGRWEGEVLVVDTVGFNDRQPRVTPKTHITERIHLEADGHLVDEMVVDDPAIYQEPYHLKYRYKPVSGEGAELMEYVCEVDPANLVAFEREQQEAGRASSFDPAWSAAVFAHPAPAQNVATAPAATSAH